MAMTDTDALQRATAAHYDEHPFDFMTAEDEANIEALQPRPFVVFVQDHLKPGDRVAEIGCGPGRGTLYLCRRGMAVHAVDISAASLEMARKRAPEAHFTLADNMSLPFADESFDAVVSDGVIHHTPDAARSFAENARILKKEGKMYVSVYKRNHYYYYLYSYVGRPIRWLARHRAGIALIHATLLPIYYAAHLIKSRGRRTWSGARNFFWDYILTPQATFHSREQLEDWAWQNGLQPLGYYPTMRTVHAFILLKK
jgi:ubiquinone/menaquinone biosynthesis C-methylase UbiE